MPNVRAKDQRGILIMMDQQFRDEIDAAFPRFGYTDRSTFIRDAVYKRLGEMGVSLPASLKAAPSRAGKGGRSKKVTVKVADKIGGQAKVTQHNHFKSASAPARKPAKGKRGKKGE